MARRLSRTRDQKLYAFQDRNMRTREGRFRVGQLRQFGRRIAPSALWSYKARMLTVLAIIIRIIRPALA